MKKKEQTATDFDSRLVAPKNDLPTLWVFTAVIVLLALLVPHLGAARPDGFVASAYQAATEHGAPPPAFGP